MSFKIKYLHKIIMSPCALNNYMKIAGEFIDYYQQVKFRSGIILA